MTVVYKLLLIPLCAFGIQQTRCESSFKDGNTIKNERVCGRDLNETLVTGTYKNNDHKQLMTGVLLAFVTASIFCNTLIIHVVRVNSHMHTTTNYLIVNMAFCDICGTVLVAIGAMAVLDTGWMFKGRTFHESPIYCKGIHLLMYMTFLCSIYSLVVITLDRFLAVTRPLKYQNRSSWTKYTIPGIWLVSMAIPAHYCVTKIVICKSNATTQCIVGTSHIDAILIIVLGFAIPHVVMVILYMVIAYKLCTRRVPGEHAQETNGQAAAKKVSRKVTAMIVCILAAFEIAWVPIFVDQVFIYVYFDSRSSFHEIKFIIYCTLAISNGIFNTLIFASFNENFRNAFQETSRLNVIKSAIRNAHNNCRFCTAPNNTDASVAGQDPARGA